MGWLKEPLANLQGRAMELEAQLAIRNLARNQARQLGLPEKHVIGETQRASQPPIDINSETLPPRDGLDHWHEDSQKTLLALTV